MNTYRAAYDVIVTARELYPEATTVEVYNYGVTMRLGVFNADTAEDLTLPLLTARAVRMALDAAAEVYAALAFGPPSAWPKQFTITHTGALNVADADRAAGDHVFNGRVLTGIGEQAIQAAHDMLTYRRAVNRSGELCEAIGLRYDAAVGSLELFTGVPKGCRLLAVARSIVKHNPVNPRSARIAAAAFAR
ncbi:hypothetical protein AB0469_35370 [Streptomyces sp. NPDC093801]|uniref:hypothetical protein n=1 Tax=Streptomyces sp. NPDC093801 TaxID=3155203 RepID=UPI00344E2366